MITQPGATFTVNLQVENVTDLFSAPVRLKFDPNVVRLSEVTRGSLLTADGGEVLFTRNILNDTGDASIVLSRMPGSPGVSGSGSLLTLTFQVVGKGVTAITAPQLSFQDSRASTIVTASPQVSVSIE
jgi:general secretion pathway protein D